MEVIPLLLWLSRCGSGGIILDISIYCPGGNGSTCQLLHHTFKSLTYRITNMHKGKYYIGTSGWKYKHWKGTFYPEGLKDQEEFDYYAGRFNTVEINNSFYHLPADTTFKSWHLKSPASFVYAVKANRYITHLKKLKIEQHSIDLLSSRAAHLKKKEGPLLFQLPPGWRLNIERFRSFLAALPKKHRYVFEFREHSWYHDDVYKEMIENNCAFCIYELAGHQSPLMVTADFVYVRLHGPGARKYQGSYSKEQLDTWAKRCKNWTEEGKDVYVYFDNDEKGYAAFNALTLSDSLLRH